MTERFNRSISPLSLIVDPPKPNPPEKGSTTALISMPLLSQIRHHVGFSTGFTARDESIWPLFKFLFPIVDVS